MLRFPLQGAQLPFGYHDTLDAFAARGWACDPDDFNAAVRVDFYMEGGIHIGSALADRKREAAVGNLCGGNPAHGFDFAFPADLRDGKTHTIHAYASGHAGGRGTLLQMSPRAASFPADASGVTGRHEDTSADGVTVGWACDPIDYGRPLDIRFYADGALIGSAIANLARESAVAERCGGYPAHGFSFDLPESLKDGFRHSLQAFAVGAGGAGEVPLQPAPMDIEFPFLTYFRQPKVEADEVGSSIFATAIPPARAFVARMHNMGPLANSAHVTWDVSRFTGFSPDLPLPSYQRGPSDDQAGTAVQMQGDTAGIWINSASAPFNGDILPVVVEQTWAADDDLRPWSSATNYLSYAFELQIPHAARSGGAEAYASAVFLFRDATSGKAFWMSILVFDLRNHAPADAIFIDGCSTCTRLLIAASSFDSNREFGGKTAASSSTQGTPWTGFKKFEYRISRDQFARVLSRVHGYDPAFSPLPEHYRLAHFNFNPEIYAPAGTAASGSIGLSIRKITIGLYKAAD